MDFQALELFWSVWSGWIVFEILNNYRINECFSIFNSKIQKFKNSKIQIFKNSKIQKLKNSKTQKLKNSTIQQIQKFTILKY